MALRFNARHAVHLLAIAMFGLWSPALYAGGVRIVDAAGSATFASIRDAVQAANPGDTLIVGEGLYASFEIDRPLSLFAAPGATVQVVGGVSIRDVHQGRVIVRGVQVVPVKELRQTAFLIENCTAGIRIVSCDVPRSDHSIHSSGRIAASVRASTNVSFQDCALNGGDGSFCGGGNYPYSGAGGTGLVLLEASSVALFDCEAIGGDVDGCFNTGTRGGGVLVGADCFFFASGSTLSRGQGASSDLPAYGLEVWPGATAETIDTAVTGGESMDSAATRVELNGQARSFTTPGVVASGTPLTATVFGLPGDRLRFLGSSQAAFEYRRYLHAPWLQPSLGYLPTGFAMSEIPSSGMTSFVLGSPELGPGETSRIVSGQGLVYERPHRPLLTNSVETLVLNREALSPDCNNNGTGDFIEVFDGLVADVNHDLIPDACQYLGPQFFVDESAPAGGDGSPGAPFRTLRDGMDHAQAGDEVVVADGVYSGPDNRNLDFLGRDFTVRSANGPAACIIDCEDQGKALQAYLTETNAAVFRGFTVLNAGTGGVQISPSPHFGGAFRIDGPASISIEDCVIEDNAVAIGAAFYCRDTPATRIRNCTVRVAGYGGVYIFRGGTHLIGTTIENNNQRGVDIIPSQEGIVLSGCTIRNNGGGVMIVGGNTGTASVTFDQCLIANNTSGNGGGIYLEKAATLRIRNSAIVGNNMSFSSGAGAFHSQTNRNGRDIAFENTIVWGNSPAQASIFVGGQGTSSLAMRNGDIEAGLNAVVYLVAGSPTSFPFTNNINADPLFVDLVDYRLGTGSPCIDAGDNALAPADLTDLDGDGNTGEPVPHDIDGQRRFADDPSVADTGNGTAPIIDIGPDEKR